MSWSMEFVGTRESVSQRVKEYAKQANNAAVFKLAGFLVAEIEEMPTSRAWTDHKTVLGVYLKTWGHIDPLQYESHIELRSVEM